MSRSSRVPAGLFDSRPYGFSQVTVVTTPRGDAVHVSGQVAWDSDQKIVGAGDIGRQLEKSLENLACYRFFALSFFQYSRRFRISRSKPRSTGR